MKSLARIFIVALVPVLAFSEETKRNAVRPADTGDSLFNPGMCWTMHYYPSVEFIDIGHGYVRRDGAIRFIGGGNTGTGAHATCIEL